MGDYKERNNIDKKFITEYIDAVGDGFSLQIYSLAFGGWIDLLYDKNEIFLSHTVDIMSDDDTVEYYLSTPIGRFYRKCIRIKMDGI